MWHSMRLKLGTRNYIYSLHQSAKGKGQSSAPPRPRLWQLGCRRVPSMDGHRAVRESILYYSEDVSVLVWSVCTAWLTMITSRFSVAFLY